MKGIHRIWIDKKFGLIEQVMEPNIPAWFHRNGYGCPSYDQLFSTEGVISSASSAIRFKPTGLPLRKPASAVTKKFRTGIIHPFGQCLGAESREDDRMGSTNPGTGQHRNRQFRDHWEIEGRVTQNPGVSRFSLPIDSYFAPPPGFDMAVHTEVSSILFYIIGHSRSKP
jgi:hypothetical protein